MSHSIHIVLKWQLYAIKTLYVDLSTKIVKLIG